MFKSRLDQLRRWCGLLAAVSAAHIGMHSSIVLLCLIACEEQSINLLLYECHKYALLFVDKPQPVVLVVVRGDRPDAVVRE